MSKHVQGTKRGSSKSSQQRRIMLGALSRFGSSISESFLRSYCPHLPFFFKNVSNVSKVWVSWGNLWSLSLPKNKSLSAADLLLTNASGLSNKKEFFMLPPALLKAARLVWRKLELFVWLLVHSGFRYTAQHMQNISEKGHCPTNSFVTELLDQRYHSELQSHRHELYPI